MIFHAPHSKSRLISLLMRRTVLHKSVVMTVGAVVSTTVVLAGRAPEIELDHSQNTYQHLDHSFISTQLGTLLEKENGMVAEPVTADTEQPEDLISPKHRDLPIGDRLYDNDDRVTVAHILPKLRENQSIQLDLSDDLKAVDSAIKTQSWGHRTVEIASLATPNDDWRALNPPILDRLPTFEPRPVEETLGRPNALDSLPEINGLEAGPIVVSFEAGAGESLEGILSRAELSENDQKATLVALRADNIADLLFEGDEIDIAMLSPDDNQLLAVRLRQFGQPPVELRWDGDTDSLWESLDITIENAVNVTTAEPEIEQEILSVTGKQDDTVLIEGNISSSLYSSAAKAGLTAGETKALSDIFRYSVDFERDLRQGDHFEALFEKKPNGAYGDILYAKLTNRGSEIALYRGVDDVTGETGYFDATGKTNKRTLMRTPLAGAQVSSHFGMRIHPVLGYSKMHRGTDFRARTGTPIFAAGDGIVDSIGRNGGYGKYIRIRHNSTYETAYAHLSKYAPNLKYGDRVRQGDIIGYVGSTGRSTGPHLHFEILKNGNQINPLKTVDFGPVKGLSGSALSAFKVRVSRIEIALSLMREKTRFATAE